MKQTNSPTQGQPNPRKIRLTNGIWATFSHSKQFVVGWDLFYTGNRLQETQPNQIIHKHPIGSTIASWEELPNIVPSHPMRIAYYSLQAHGIVYRA